MDDAESSGMLVNASASPHEYENTTWDMTPRTRANWIVIRVPTLIYMLCSIYIAVVLSLEEYHRRRQRGDRQMAHWRIARLVAAYVSAFAYFCGGISLILEADADVTCDAAIKFENACYWVNLSAIYVAIWFRQRVIYENPGIKDNTSKCTSGLGYVIGALVVALPIMNAAVFISTVRFLTFTECEYANVLNPYALMLCENIVPLFLPLTLLGLFIWPFSHNCCSSGQTSLLQRSTKSVIRRMILAAVGCAVTDMLAGIGPWFLPIYVRFVAQQTSSFCNLVFLILTFKNWRTLMHPYKYERIRTQSQSSIASTRISSNNLAVTYRP